MPKTVFYRILATTIAEVYTLHGAQSNSEIQYSVFSRTYETPDLLRGVLLMYYFVLRSVPLPLPITKVNVGSALLYAISVR